MGERVKCSGILRDRMTAAGQLVGNFGAELDVLLEYSKPIEEIRDLEITSQSILYLEGAEQIVAMTRRILAGYAAIGAKKKEQI